MIKNMRTSRCCEVGRRPELKLPDQNKVKGGYILSLTFLVSHHHLKYNSAKRFVQNPSDNF